MILVQGQVKADLEKERSKMEELLKAKTNLEKNNAKLMLEMKTLTERSDKVSTLQGCFLW